MAYRYALLFIQLKICGATERFVLYMKNNLDHIQQLDLNIDVQPSYLVIPENLLRMNVNPGIFSE